MKFISYNFLQTSNVTLKHWSKFVRYKSVCVRFAPSPTGFLHLGGLRTALYNHLFALSNNGKTILRIEDTDQERKVDGAERQLVKDLTWCGLTFMEGPVRQSDRLSLYKESVDYLLSVGSAYRCFCTSSRLDILRREALRAGQVPRYDNRCRTLSNSDLTDKLAKNTPCCVRFKLVPTPEPFTDLIYGEIRGDIAALEGDPVILKTDGFPTYHLANVVDDHHMNITHVLRGVEWQGSTQKHLLLYKAFKWEPPKFGHLPLLLNPDGSKLSKRQGDVDVRQYRAKGIFPLAVINFVVRAGGGFNIDHAEMDLKSFTIEELTEKFDLRKIKVNSCKVDLDKLKVSNQLELTRQLQNDDATSIVRLVQNAVSSHFSDSNYKIDISDKHVLKILRWAQNRIHFVDDLIKSEWRFLWVIPQNVLLQDHERLIVKDLIAQLRGGQFTIESLKVLCVNHATKWNIKFAALMKMLRSALSGLKEGPGVVEMMDILGKEEVIQRLETALVVEPSIENKIKR